MEYIYNLFDNGNRPKSDLKFQYSSLGPSNHGEAFWNHGIFGLITISVVIGYLYHYLQIFFLCCKYKIYPKLLNNFSWNFKCSPFL